MIISMDANLYKLLSTHSPTKLHTYIHICNILYICFFEKQKFYREKNGKLSFKKLIYLRKK